MPNLPIDVLVGADVLTSHLLQSVPKEQSKRLQFGIQVFIRCAQYRGDPEVGSQKQLRFVDRSVKRNRTRTSVGYNFLATLPEAVCDDSDSDKLAKLDETSSPLDEPNGPQLHQPDDPGQTLSTSPYTVSSPSHFN